MTSNHRAFDAIRHDEEDAALEAEVAREQGVAAENTGDPGAIDDHPADDTAFRGLAVGGALQGAGGLGAGGIIGQGGALGVEETRADDAAEDEPTPGS